MPAHSTKIGATENARKGSWVQRRRRPIPLDQLSIGSTGIFMATLFPRQSPSISVKRMSSSSDDVHRNRKRATRSRGMRRPEGRIQTKQLQYNVIPPSSSDELDFRISSTR
ncbi:unnamed protein product [Protopolystoma xenopodis]|uniref:Uncharacterized protein n=1 Tax=Protopolystoma xenopodis TaxID=117903 RepID=A0A448XRE3_9PLAT|nr:unnamed protein product [Protopolystoma xenopodis]